MDGVDGQAKVRRSGVPIQHRLSDALGEAVLFCLDFAVNKTTESNLYRMHDDIWFWGDKDSTVKAWRIIQQFTKVMGLRLNDAKTGAIELDGVSLFARQLGFSEGLQAGPITWGFLKIGPSGKWMIADKQVEAHVKELQLQLQACKSNLAWVQAWNAYAARYLSNNLGEPSNCLGRPHLDLVIETFDNIQSRVFAADGLSRGNVIEHLRGKLRTRFGVIDIPDGFFSLSD